MAPPPAATPSSNRFIFKKPGATPPSGADQQSQINREGDIETSAFVPRQPVAQFAAIPRFSAPRTRAVRASSYPPRSPSPSKLDFATPKEAPTPQPKAAQDVGSSDNENDDEEMLDNEIGPVDLGHLSPVATDAITSQPDQPKEIASTPSMFPPSSKRPRLMQPSYPSGSQQPSKPGASRFIVPVSPSSSHLARPAPFLASSLLTQASVTSEVGVKDSPSRPAFLKPSLPPPDANAAPLPEAFSPHRRGNRHVPGGMAAELSSWVLEAGQAAVSGRRGKGYLQGNDFVRKIKATRTRDGDGAVFLEGIDGEWVETRLVLAGGEERKEKISEGETIGIREPSWEVLVEGQKWVVGADWRVLRR